MILIIENSLVEVRTLRIVELVVRGVRCVGSVDLVRSRLALHVLVDMLYVLIKSPPDGQRQACASFVGDVEARPLPEVSDMD